MKLSDFDYYLPKEFIAQEPATPRDSSKLLVIDRKKQTIKHKIFKDIGDFLNKGDLLVINNAKVFPARLLGKKEITGGKIDLLLIEEVNKNLWKCLVQGSGRIKKGLNIVFGDNKLKGKVEDYDKGIYLVRFEYEGKFNDILEEIGEMPLPPYIKEASEASKKRYQTVYAEKTGAIAAPTAGFHFTEELINNLKEKGISFAIITLIVGRGTFNPIKTENVEEHLMDEEYFEIDEEAKKKINTQLKNKGRIIAVGTTTVRTLESVVQNGKVMQTKGKTSLFIYPGYKFNAVDTFITNFHWPKSTPLLLTCAFGGKELIFKAYQEAIERKYRFYSFGDAMLIR
jgi:S-adenosylmethionine:tRNA ribosyltransferase-isomerase